MSKLAQSALNRVGRTLLQFAVSAAFVQGVLDGIAGLELSPTAKTILVGAVQAVVAYLHRRFLDPSPVPSLVDGQGQAATAYDGMRVAGDGRGLT